MPGLTLPGSPPGVGRRRLQLADLYPQMVSLSITSATQSAAVWATVNTDAAAHTKGAWVELVASTAAEADIINLIWYGIGGSGATNSALADVAVGAAGAETVIVANVGLAYTAGSTGNMVGSLMLPVKVPRGSRIAVRWQSERASATAASFRCDLYRWNPALGVRSPSVLVNLNADTATSTGTATGSTNNTWVQAVAATPQAFQALIVCPVLSDPTLSASAVIFDVAVGAAGAETVFSNLDGVWRTGTSEEIIRVSTFGFGVTPGHIPAGSRLAVRHRDASTSNTAYSVVLLGVPYA